MPDTYHSDEEYHDKSSACSRIWDCCYYFCCYCCIIHDKHKRRYYD